MNNIQDPEDIWLNDEKEESFWVFFQGTLAGMLAFLMIAVIMAQLYKYGQRHPDPSKFCTYAAAIDLANEREAYGRSACK